VGGGVGTIPRAGERASEGGGGARRAGASGLGNWNSKEARPQTARRARGVSTSLVGYAPDAARAVDAGSSWRGGNPRANAIPGNAGSVERNVREARAVSPPA